MLNSNRFKCCKEDTTVTIPKAEKAEKVEAPETLIEDEAEEKAADDSYNCCGAW